MYDGHIYSREYGEIKRMIIDMMNGEEVQISPKELADQVQELYENEEMQATQYDDLMRYLQDLM